MNKKEPQKRSLQEAAIGSTKVSQALPVLNLIASDWNLNLSRSRHFKTAVRIMKHSVINN